MSGALAVDYRHSGTFPGGWMRFRSFVLWVIALAGLAWGGYTIVYASSSYFEAGSLIDRAVAEAQQRRRTAASVGGADLSRLLIDNIRAGILDGAGKAGIPLDEGALSVTETPD